MLVLFIAILNTDVRPERVQKCFRDISGILVRLYPPPDGRFFGQPGKRGFAHAHLLYQQFIGGRPGWRRGDFAFIESAAGPVRSMWSSARGSHQFTPFGLRVRRISSTELSAAGLTSAVIVIPGVSSAPEFTCAATDSITGTMADTGIGSSGKRSCPLNTSQ